MAGSGMLWTDDPPHGRAHVAHATHVVLERLGRGPLDGQLGLHAQRVGGVVGRGVLARQAEVRHLGRALRRDEHVARRQVAVHHALPLQVLHAAARVTGQAAGLDDAGTGVRTGTSVDNGTD